MSNAIFAGLNRIDEATLTEGPEETLHMDFMSDLYGIVGANPLPVSQLKNRLLHKVWRTTSADPRWTWFVADFGQARSIDVVALIKHNGTTSGQWRIRFSNDPYFATSIYDSGLINLWPSQSGFGSLPWGTFPWGGVVNPEQATNYYINSIHILPASQSARYMRIDISDPTNPSGYFQLGRALASPVYRPSTNIQYNWGIGWEDSSLVRETIDGVIYGERRRRRRVITFNLEHIPELELYGNISYLDRVKGVIGDMLFIPQPDKPDLLLHEAIYCRMRELAPAINPYFERRSRAFVLEELL